MHTHAALLSLHLLMTTIQLQGEILELLPEKAIWWPAQQAIIVSDLHWGKTAHFRRHGIAIPSQVQAADEIRLASLISRYNATQLIIAGDLFHSRHNSEVAAFAHWRQAHAALRIILVSGNHDILPREHYESWQMEVYRDKLQVGPFVIQHDMSNDCDNFCIHGHVHPAVMIKGRGHTGGMKIDCFAVDEHRLILPAFGSFTGKYILDPGAFHHIYLAAGNEVMQWQ